MIFSIRDDDTCFFTKPEELQSAYDFVEEGSVSLSVIPYAYPYHAEDKPFGENIPEGLYDFAENAELAEFLRENVRIGKNEILLHGYSHKYRRQSGRWIPEMTWKNADELYAQIRDAKEHVETVLNTTVRVFVAPSNEIGVQGIDIIEKLGMDYSGIIGRRPDRRFSLLYAWNYIHKTIYETARHIPYSGVYRYPGHRELYAHPLKDFSSMERIFSYCRDRDLPFAVYTHYWDLNRDPIRKRTLEQLYRLALSAGCPPAPLSACFS